MSTNETNDGVNEGFGDRPDGSADEPRHAADDAASGEAGDAGDGRRRRRRRRRRGERAPEVVDASAPIAPAPITPASPAPADRPRRDWGARIRDIAEPSAPLAAPATDAPAAAPPASSPASDAAPGRRERARARREERARERGRDARPSEARGEARGEARADAPSSERGARRGSGRERTRGAERARGEAARGEPALREPPTPRLEPARRPAPPPVEEIDPEPSAEQPSIAWGTDDAGPPAPVTLAPDLPVDAPDDDPDPVSYPLVDGSSGPLGDSIASVVGVRFVQGGRIQWCDAGDHELRPGDRVLVDSERGHRLATIATSPLRRAVRDRGLRRVLRRASEQDLRGECDSDAERAKALRIAKDAAAALRMPMKVFRVELSGPLGRGGKLNVYYTSDERLDLREFLRDVAHATGARVELRQLGVRDEAKAVGGIGSCGLTLCCTTWLPDFVPVSIKMAKDQGLVLSPTKVSGQCGRLKCCLVYEQAGYAELRKGLPKLGKRVVAPRGEGRVVEVDVLRQRVRVSYGLGDTEVLPAAEVKPLFPSGSATSSGAARSGARGAPRAADSAEPDEDASSDDQGPTDDPSSDHFRGTDEASSDDYDA